MNNIKKIIAMGLLLSGQIASCSNILPKALTTTNEKTGPIIRPLSGIITGIEKSGITIESLQSKEFYTKNAPIILAPIVIAVGSGTVLAITQSALKMANEHLGEWVIPLTASVGIINGCVVIEDFIFNSLGMKDIKDKEKIQYASCSALYTAFVAAMAYNISQQEIPTQDQVK